MRRPGEWKEQMAQVDATIAKGIRAYPMCTPNRITDFFTMRNTQTFRGLPTWHPILLASHEEKLRAYSDPEVRKKLHDEAVEFKIGPADRHLPHLVGLHDGAARGAAEEQGSEGKTVGQIAKAQGKGIIDAFLDLVVEENLDTAFLHGENNVDDDAVGEDPELPERDHRSVGRRRARAVPERLRLQHPAPGGVGARARRSCRWRRRCGG